MKNRISLLFLASSIIFVEGCSNNAQTYKVDFCGDQATNHLIYVGENKANNNGDYKLNFIIDYNYELSIDNIHVTVGGKENNECWSFLYQTNEKNVFTIFKESIVGDIQINAIATPRSSTQSEYGYIFDERITNICDCRFSDDREPKFIPTLDQVAYPVLEDDSIDVFITLKEGVPYEDENKVIFDNIWFRTNARYAKINVDFYKTYSNENRECRISVPHYVIRDHGSFQPKLDD
ncbi:MAG: hypothetical protein MJ239_06150 [Bacilli bacterium]|nr:hypothetical protein [Bacilli bacterium]